MEETNSRLLLPKLGAKMYKIPLGFFVLPTLIAGYAVLRLGFSPQEWRTWAIAACAGTATFAVFRYITFPNLFRRAVERTHATPRTGTASQANPDWSCPDPEGANTPASTCHSA
jgi:hypothetical protein